MKTQTINSNKRDRVDVCQLADIFDFVLFEEKTANPQQNRTNRRQGAVNKGIQSMLLQNLKKHFRTN